jgi:hypothetical protein
MRASEYIEEVKRVAGLDTDYKVNKMFGWPSNRVTKYRDGVTMDNQAASQIAEVLGIPVMKVIADMEVQRFTRMNKENEAKRWEKFAKQAGRVTAKLLFILPFLSSLALYTVYYVKLSMKEQCH